MSELMEATKIKLNLGCGTGKIDGYINIDIDKALEPDQVFDIRGQFPLDDSSVSEIVCYHTIEHVDKAFWQPIFLECSRVLELGGKLVITFPNYLRVFEYWRSNHRGLRGFWEAVIFGRGASEHDRHVSITTENEINYHLLRSGFEIVQSQVEPSEDHNWMVVARNVKPYLYKDVLKERVWPTEQNCGKGLQET